ncbi:helix-turn-helix domain protein [Delftia sp. Cs1-4]|uniref:helix-turn-helix domain-containing protein n=1 Tax=Delftia sp. (strain Cs1-4) TaxID=742013 RepID=UPI00020E7AE0|nr:helix-turn-helix transcriptional regulator [Delftia sp. Cs1-4]AEF88750.1 helix-turn-helix domain protein [Delftia sp. Cs1-4]
MELEYEPLVCFGRHLAATRRKAGVSQEALAYESGLSRSYLSEVERGLRNIALRNICILAAALNVPPAQLLEFDQEQNGGEGSDQG